MCEIKCKPMGDRVFVRPIFENRTGSGIIIPLDKNEKPTEGIVVRVGGRVKEIKAGDYVYIPTYITQSIHINNEDLMIMCESDILAVKE